MINEGPHPQGERFNFFPNSSTHLCFKCPSPDHLIRDCSEKIRCFYCYNYGHKARFCNKRRLDQNLKWALKLSKCHPFKETSGEGEISIQWSFGPNAPSDVPASSTPPVHNSDPHPFQGPIVPGEVDHVVQAADQVMDHLIEAN
jgi:hypothetical protein